MGLCAPQNLRYPGRLLSPDGMLAILPPSPDMAALLLPTVGRDGGGHDLGLPTPRGVPSCPERPGWPPPEPKRRDRPERTGLGSEL